MLSGMSTRREVAIVPHDSQRKLYGVQVRQRSKWGGWSSWRELITVTKQCAWPYALARQYADQALANGWVPGVYHSQAFPIIETDVELAPAG
jgi:hypothetical protein